MRDVTIAGGLFLNTSQAVVLNYVGASHTAQCQDLLPTHSLGIPNEHQAIKGKEVAQGNGSPVVGPVRCIDDLIIMSEKSKKEYRAGCVILEHYQ